MSRRTDMAGVVIGRNEGQRLELSLRSVEAAGLPVVYVDSGSSDGSVQRVLQMELPIVQLDSARPFSAARARNEGLGEALRRWPELQFVMFVDGDTVLEPPFPSAALSTFADHPECAIVTGHLLEFAPEASVYNRLCAMEWRSPAGLMDDVNRLGGIMAARISALDTVGRFNENAIAGEEPDLGIRLMLAGHSLIKADEPMAVHDAEIFTFRQWWMRAVRGGHAVAHRYARHGGSRFRDCRREIFSALFWGLVLPLSILVLLWPTRGFSLILLGGYGVISWRVYRYALNSGFSAADATLAARFNIYSKFAHVMGITRYGLNRMRGSFRIIEYK